MPDFEFKPAGNTGTSRRLKMPRGHETTDEARLLEYLDDQLSPSEAAAVETHLVHCEQCRALKEQWQQLDARLASGLARPQLSPGFALRLWQQIRLERAPDSQSSLERRKAEVETEWQTTWRDIRRRFLRANLPAIADGFGYGTAAAVVGYYAVQLGARGAGPLQSLNLALAVSLMVGLACLGFAGRKYLARWYALL